MIKINNLSKGYGVNNRETIALDGINMEFEDKGFYSIVGKSGSGKSTLLNMIGLLETPDTGDVFFHKVQIDYENEKLCESIRVNDIGFVFQDFNLLFDFSVIENIRIVGMTDEKEIQKILSLVELEKKISTPVRYLSGGEKQRLSIARAIAKNSKILLLDEPTGNLDKENTENIFSILKKLSADKLVVLATHDLSSAYKYSDIVYQLNSGKMVGVWNSPYNHIAEFLISNSVLDTVSEISNYLQPLISNDSLKINIHYQDDITEINVDKTNLIQQINDLIQFKVGEKIGVSVLLETDFKSEELIMYNKSNRAFNFVFLLKYALTLIKNKKKRFITTFLLLSMSLLLTFIYMSIVNFDINSSSYEAISMNQVSVIPIESTIYNENSDEFITYNSGLYLYERYQDRDIDSYFLTSPDHLYVFSDNDINLSLTVVITDDNLSNVIITDFASKYVFNTDSATGHMLLLNNSKLNVNDLSFEVTGILGTDYSINKLNSFLSNQDFYLNNYDQLKYFYNVVYISKNIYVNAFEDKTIKLNSANFALSNETSSYYSATFNDLLYSIYKDENISYGRMPIADNEIVITLGFYNEYLSNMHIENVIDYEFQYKDLRKSINSNLYQNKLNLFDISHSVKVVGIVSDDNLAVYTSETMFRNITTDLSEYYVEGIVFKNSPTLFEDITYVHSFGDKLKLNSTIPVYILKNAVDSTTNNILLFLGIIFISIAILSTIQYTSVVVTSKYREIAVFRSLGKSRGSISLIFYMHNLIQSIFSTCTSIILGYVTFAALNQLLKGRDYFNVNYDILNVHWTSIIIPIALSTFIIIVSTTLSLLQSLKNDINIIIKNA